MRRIIAISLSALLYLLLSSVGSEQMGVALSAADRVQISSAVDPYSQDLATLRECGSDMLSSASFRGVSCVESVIPHSSSFTHLRHRCAYEIKHTPHIEPCRHLGHVTDIFDYDNFRSSHRNGYYLHFVCRLRI